MAHDQLIKICGLSTPETIRAACDAGASHVGLVHFAKSPRNVSLDRAAELRAGVPQGVKAVVLVVDPDAQTLADIISAVRPDAIQFHGSETPARLAEVRAQAGCEVWKALPVRNAASLRSAASYDDVADLILFDAPAPEGSALPGGNGETFGWDHLRGFDRRGRWGLAGGLSPDNVDEAIRATKAPLVDVSSGVESAPGVKDVDRIAAFCKAALKA